MLPQSVVCTEDEKQALLDEYRLNEGQTLESLSNSSNAPFIDSVCNFIKGMGYANRRDQALQEKKIKDNEEVKKKGQDRVDLEKVMRTEIPSRFYPTTVDYDRERWPEGLATMKSFFNLYKKGDRPNMYISGQSYCGKSHLVA
ncbi:unnamed protein product, partial [marine sediment metagenome]